MNLNFFLFVGLLVVPIGRWLMPALREADLWRTIASSVGSAFVSGVVASALTAENALDGSLQPFGAAFAVVGASGACLLRGVRLSRESTAALKAFTLPVQALQFRLPMKTEYGEWREPSPPDQEPGIARAAAQVTRHARRNAPLPPHRARLTVPRLCQHRPE